MLPCCNQFLLMSNPRWLFTSPHKPVSDIASTIRNLLLTAISRGFSISWKHAGDTRWSIWCMPVAQVYTDRIQIFLSKNQIVHHILFHFMVQQKKLEKCSHTPM